MAVPAIAMYAVPPSMCSAPHQISPHASYDFDVNGRTASSASASSSHKHLIGGLSYLFSSLPIKSAASYSGGIEDRTEELGSSFRYSSVSPSSKRDQAQLSPVSVLAGGGGSSNSIGSGSRSPNLRFSGDFSSIRSGNGGKFNGFVTHALGSCVDFESSSLTLDVEEFRSPSSSSSSSSQNGDELTFNMEDTFMESDLPPYARDLLSDAQSRHLIFRHDLVVKAFHEAEKAHRGQMRATGHPYLQHCVETALLLANIGVNSTVVAVGLLHDTIDDSSVTYENISRSFGIEVADLVKGVSRLSHLSKLARDNNTACKTAEADRLHTMFLAMTDARAVLIKLADRLHNMMTLDALPLIKRQRLAKETMEIFAPLANRLGIFTWKEQLENLCFEHLHPDRYQELSSKLVESFDEAVITSSLEKLERALQSGGISYHWVSGRHKSLYSIYSKMLKKILSIDEIHDIHGLRLVVKTEEDCYKALRIVREIWDEVPGRFKDYILCPKFNGYQSLHTVVSGDNMIPLEVQIRTKEMHVQAEYGFAAHWRYKEGGCKHSSFVLQMVKWARWVMSWQCETMSKDGLGIDYIDSTKTPCSFPTHSKDCKFSCNPHCGSDGPVFVILIENDKMSVQEFRANSTIRDVLETAGRGGGYRWTSYGLAAKEDLRPRVNREPVNDPTLKLKMGDVVELTPAIPDKSLTEYREEIQRMYNGGRVAVSGGPTAKPLRS